MAGHVLFLRPVASAVCVPDCPACQRLYYGLCGRCSDSLCTHYPSVPESGFSKPTVNGQWQKCVGRCFAKRDGHWVQRWQTEPIDLLFQPLPLAGDFDGDGAVEIAVLPFHELLLLDGRTGRVKDRCRFTDTRSYGFFGVYDFDRDGRDEFLVQADFSKHIDVLGFRDGKLHLLWQHAVEADISNPQKILRVGPNPVADVDGDGRLEVLSCTYNDEGDQRWRVRVHDALNGRVQAELPDEILATAVDVDGDGTSELLTTVATSAGLPEFGVIRVRSLRGGQSRVLWEQPDSAWPLWDQPLPPNVKSTATHGTKTVLCRALTNGFSTVLSQKSKASTDPKRRAGWASLRLVRWESGKFQTLCTVTGPGLQALGLNTQGHLLARTWHAPGAKAAVEVSSGKATLKSTRRLGCSPGPVVVARTKDDNAPTIVVQGASEETVLFQPPTARWKTPPLLRLPVRGQSMSWPETRGPVVADLAGNGRRQLLTATASPSGSARFLASDLTGRELWHHDFERIPGTPPVWNTGGIILWQAGHFTDRRRQDVLVTIRRSMMHSEETLLLSGRDGHELWRRNRQISQRGVGGTPFALADFDGDGLEDAVSLNPSILYILKGANGRDILAKDATWDSVPAKPVYWGLPVAGNFAGGKESQVYFGGRSMTGLVRGDGSLVWWDALDHSAPELPAFGDFDGDGTLESIGIGYEDGVRCYNLRNGHVKWRLASPLPDPVVGCATADLDSDGRDEAVFTMGRTVLAFGATRDGMAGEMRWRLDLPTSLGPPTVASLDKEDDLVVLVMGADGFVTCLR